MSDGVNREIEQLINYFTDDYELLKKDGCIEVEDAVERKEDIERIFEIVNENGLVFAQFLKENEELYERFRFVFDLYLRAANSNERTISEAKRFADELGAVEHPLSYSIKIVEKNGLGGILDTRNLFVKDTRPEEIRPLVADMLTDFMYCSRKGDEDFTVDDARKFFSKKENREAFMKIVGEEFNKKMNVLING